jgi:hypothetical protein
LRYYTSSEVVLLSPRYDACGFTTTRDWCSRWANIAHVNTYSSSVFAELGDFFEVRVDATNAITEVY